MSDIFVGDITATRRADGTVRLRVTPGPLRVTRAVLAQADPSLLARADDVVTFRGTEDDGTRREYRYRIAGEEFGPEGGWLLCEPLP